MFFKVLFMFVFLIRVLFSTSCILYFVLLCVLFLLLYIVVSFIFLHKFTDHCHQVETQL